MVNMSNGLARPTGLMTPERPPVQEAAPQQGNPETMQALLQLLMMLMGGMGGQGMGQPAMGQAPMGQPAPAPMAPAAPMMGGMGGP